MEENDSKLISKIMEKTYMNRRKFHRRVVVNSQGVSPMHNSSQVGGGGISLP